MEDQGNIQLNVAYNGNLNVYKCALLYWGILYIDLKLN